MPRIDLHAHVFPDAYRQLLVSPDGTPFAFADVSVEDLEAEMTKHEIDATVISTGPPGAYLGDVGRAKEIARAANESLAAIVRSDSDRFGALALLPLPDVDAALEELAYALDVLKLDGVNLLTNTAGVYLGDPDLEPLHAELNRRGAYTFVHPTMPPYQAPLGDLHPLWLYELPFETTRALANLVFSGTFERYPNVRMQFSHLGGATPFLVHRLGLLAEWEPQRAEKAPAGVAEYLSRQYFDTALSQTSALIETVRQFAPPERVVFGTDWPYLHYPEDSADPTPGLAELGRAGREQVDSRNATALVPRLTERWKR